MNLLRPNMLRVAITAMAFVSIAFAQQAPPSPPGTYYLLKDSHLPPFPVNPYPELEAAEAAPGVFVVDDTVLPDTPEQAAARAIRQEAEERAARMDPATRQRLAEEAARKRQEDWQIKKAEAAPRLRPLIAPGQRISAEKRLQVAKEQEALRAKAARSRAEGPAKEQAMEELSRRLGAPRKLLTGDGKTLILSDEIAGSPAYVGSLDTVSAAGISADELWPSGAWPYSDDNTGLNLTGAGQTLGMWEAAGGVRTSHLEFGGRVQQRDNAALDALGHATQVAGTMASAGSGNLFTNPVDYNEARGVAYGATVFAYNLEDFATERQEAAAGDEVDPPVVESNHSWGFFGGWRSENNVWVWYGPPEANFTEDPKFGLYTKANLGDTGCEDVDLFLQTEAPRHLMVYACGNDRLEGPQGPVIYYRVVGGQYVQDITPRDWSNGDEGGFDSLATPGTAKNVLTVGACEDVYHLVGGNTAFGFGSAAHAEPAAFSGAGPTDDGRLKPDLVAVGTPYLPARQALGEVYLGVVRGLIAPTANADDAFETLQVRGTSFAAPAVTGALGLALQRREQLYPGLTPAEAWLNSTLKAIAIDTCDDVGTAGPDYRMGHGIFNAKRAVERVAEDQAIGRGSLIKELTVPVSESLSWIVESDGFAPLSVTLAWSDPPGESPEPVNAADPQNPMLVNNLDLVVEQLDSQTEFPPWVLNPDLNGKSAALRGAGATRGVDNRNNVERVSVATPAAGLYRVTVTHSGGVAGNPAPSTQAASVVLGGVEPEPPAITELASSPTANEFLLTFEADPGAYFTIEASTDLATWTQAGTVQAEAESNTVLLTSASAYRFWRLRRAQ